MLSSLPSGTSLITSWAKVLTWKHVWTQGREREERWWGWGGLFITSNPITPFVAWKTYMSSRKLGWLCLIKTSWRKTFMRAIRPWPFALQMGHFGGCVVHTSPPTVILQGSPSHWVNVIGVWVVVCVWVCISAWWQPAIGHPTTSHSISTVKKKKKGHTHPAHPVWTEAVPPYNWIWIDFRILWWILHWDIFKLFILRLPTTAL